jgi:hypothetical protein
MHPMNNEVNAVSAARRQLIKPLSQSPLSACAFALSEKKADKPADPAGPQFGYQDRLPVRDFFRVGIGAFDAHCQRTFGGMQFSQLDHAEQGALAKAAETGALELENISAREFFNQLPAESRMGYFCNPRHGSNKNMAAWKMIGNSGARNDNLYSGTSHRKIDIPCSASPEPC